jgi:hypothetical protein
MMRPGGRARAVVLVTDNEPRQEEPHQMRPSSPTEQDRLSVPVMRDLNRGQSLLGDGDVRTTNIVVIVHIRVGNLNQPAWMEWTLRCCACPTRPTDATTT